MSIQNRFNRHNLPIGKHPGSWSTPTNANLIIRWLAGNIVTVLESSTIAQWDEGKAWYLLRNAECQKLADDNGLTLEQVVSVVASLSPAVLWELNLEYGRQLIERGRVSGYIGYREQLLKAHECITMGFQGLHGPKVHSFAWCIYHAGYCSIACVDRHVIGLSHGYPVSGEIAPRHYPLYAAALTLVAAMYGLTVPQCQAIVWLVWRNTHQYGKDRVAHAIAWNRMLQRLGIRP